MIVPIKENKMNCKTMNRMKLAQKFTPKINIPNDPMKETDKMIAVDLKKFLTGCDNFIPLTYQETPTSQFLLMAFPATGTK